MLAEISMLLRCFLTLQVASSGAQNGIYVAIEGLRTDKGQVICSLYSSAEEFPKNDKKAIARSKSVIAKRRPKPACHTRILELSGDIAMFHLSVEIESHCPFCPYEQTSQFIEAMYRSGHGTWEQLEDYCSRLKRFRDAIGGCPEWVKQSLSKAVGVPEHHVNRERTTIELTAQFNQERRSAE
jgi:hypothetical protein